MISENTFNGKYLEFYFKRYIEERKNEYGLDLTKNSLEIASKKLASLFLNEFSKMDISFFLSNKEKINKWLINKLQNMK